MRYFIVPAKWLEAMNGQKNQHLKFTISLAQTMAVSKKIFFVVLLAAFLYNIAGYFFVFAFQQAGIRNSIKEMFAEAAPASLTVIKINNTEINNLEWEGSDELRFQGKMYDVVLKKQYGNCMYLYCYSDEKEDHLYASLDTHIKNHVANTGTGKNSKRIFKNCLSDYLIAGVKNNSIFFVSSTQSVIPQNCFCFSLVMEKPSPPPRWV